MLHDVTWTEQCLVTTGTQSLPVSRGTNQSIDVFVSYHVVMMVTIVLALSANLRVI